MASRVRRAQRRIQGSGGSLGPGLGAVGPRPCRPGGGSDAGQGRAGSGGGMRAGLGRGRGSAGGKGRCGGRAEEERGGVCGAGSSLGLRELLVFKQGDFCTDI